VKVAKSIDELYNEVKGYDIVISNDAALVTALNNRIDVPRVGRLASTPKMIAKDHEDAVLEKLMDAGLCTNDGKYGIMDDVKLLDVISNETGYDVRFVHGEIENIRTIRRYRKDVQNFLFGKPSKKIYEAFVNYPTYEMVMSSFDPAEYRTYDDKKVAVIGLDLFDQLDKHFIPVFFDEIDMFKENGRYDLETVCAVGNDRQVAEHAADLLTSDNSEDAAIVMDSDGPIADAVRSALYRKGIAFKNTLSARDIVNIRDYMEFVGKALSYDILTVGDVRELFAGYGAGTDDKHDEYLLNRYTSGSGENFRKLSAIMMNIREHTFSEVCDKIVHQRHKGTVRMILDELNLLDKPIHEKTVGSASYLINSMDGIRHNAEIPENEKRGVLLADCKNSVFIDRPFIIYLNIDGAWSKPLDGKSYIDRKDEEEKDLQRFQILLQQGSSRIYLVNTMKNGKPARPCTLFGRLNTDDGGSPMRTDSFEKLVNTVVRKGTWHHFPVPVKKERLPPSVKNKLGKFSKTSMNMYVSCPRAYMFSELIRTPDKESTVYGSMIHEFAEFCFCYPDLAKNNIEHCTDMVSEACAGISCPERKELDRSKIKMSMNGISKFIDSLNADVRLNVDVSTKKRKNMFFEEFHLKMTSDLCERDHQSDRYPMHGEFDLLIGNRIIDYKTGRSQTYAEIAKKMDLGRKNDFFELQPFVYLSILDDISDLKGPKDFVLFHTADNDMESIDPEFDIMRNTRTIRLLEMNKTEIVRSRLLLDLVTKAKDREFIRNDIGKGFIECLLKAGVENAHTWKDDGFLFESILALQEKRTKGVESAIRYAIKMAGELISGCFIEADGQILIPRESIKKFKEYAKKTHSEAEERQLSGFPYEPRTDCGKCGFFHLCTGGVIDDISE